MAVTVGIQSQLQRSLMMKYNDNKLMVDRVMSDMGIDTSIINENLRHSTVDQVKFGIASKGNESFKRMIPELYPERDGKRLTRLETFRNIFENEDNKRGVVNALFYGIAHSHLPILDENGIPDTSQNWRSRNFNGGMSAFNLTYDLDGDYGKNPLNFKSSTKGDGYIDEIPEFTGTKKQRKNTAVMPFGTAPQMQEVNTSEYNEYLDRFAEGLKVKEKLDKLRGDNPLAFEGKTDKFIYDAYQNAKINSTQKMSQVFKPVNAESSFYKYAELTKGTSSEDGDYSTRGMKILGETNNGTKLTYKEVANALGYDSLQEFNEAMKSSSTMGTVPTDIDYPFATAFSVAKKDGSRKTILVETDDSLEQFHKHPSNMIKNLMNGVVAQYAGQSTFLMDPSDKNSVTPVHNYYVNTLNPRFNAYENVLVQSVHKFTEEDLKYLKLHRNPNGTLSGSAYLGKEQILYNHVTLRTHQQVLDDAVNNILGTYDNQATTKSVKERIPQLLKK